MVLFSGTISYYFFMIINNLNDIFKLLGQLAFETSIYSETE